MLNAQHIGGGNVFRENITLVSFIAFFCISLISDAQASQYSVQGSISCTVFTPNGKVFTNQYLPNHPFHFSALVASNAWSIKVDFGPNYYVWVGCDASNCYSLLEDPNARKASSSSMPGTISKGIYPVGENWYITVPWLSICSSFYFQTHGLSNLPAIWLNPRIDASASIFEADAQFLPESFLPDSIQFKVRTNLAFRFRELDWLDSRYRQPDEFARGETVPDGFLAGEYHVNVKTNVHGIVLPIAAEVNRYSMIPDTGKAQLYSRFELIVTEINLSTNSFLLPEMKGPVTVADYRYRDISSEVDFITYGLSNKTWAIADESALASTFERKRSEAVKMGVFRPTVSMRTRRVRILVLALVALTAFLPPLLWWLRKQRNSANKPKNI